MKSIEKLPADRFDSASEFRAALDDQGFAYTAPTRARPTAAAQGAGPAAAAGGGVSRWLPWGVAAALVAALAWATLSPEPAEQVQRFPLRLGNFVATGGTPFDISPDGTTLVYTREDAMVYWRPMSALEAQVIAGSESSRSPFFSPDGRSIGYTTGPASNDQIRTMSLDGAPPRTLAGDHFPGASWGEDGYVYYVHLDGSLFRVSDQGGQPERLTDSDELPTLRLPEPLPGGRVVLAHTLDESESRIVAIDIASGELTELERGTHVRFVGGYLFWIQETTLFAAPFDPDAVEFEGPGMEVADGVREALQGSFEYTVSETGTLIYQSDPDGGLRSFAAVFGWVDEQGTIEGAPGVEAAGFIDIDQVAPSRDGRFVAMEVGSENLSYDQPLQIWIHDLEQQSSTRLTFRGSRNRSPRWMPDGRHLAYLSDQDEQRVGIYMQPFDRTGSDELLVSSELPMRSFDVSPVEGAPMIVQVAGSAVDADLFLATPGSDELTPFLATEFREQAPRISPDGRWVAYTSDEAGRIEVYVRAFPEGGRPWLISRNGGHFPVWGRDETELFFQTPSPSSELVRVTLNTGDDVRVVDSEVFFFTGSDDIEISGTGRPWASYDVWPSDGRIIAPMNDRATTRSANVDAVVVLNMFEELDARRRR
jgi:serine/threonine-protein kinase